MRRTLLILAATALAAAVTIPAAAQVGTGGADAQDPALARFTACLAGHGVAVPAGLDGPATKQWVAAHQDQAPVGAALAACAGPRPQMDGRDFAELYACLHDHGVDVPNAPDALKRQVLTLSQTDAGRATLEACHLSPAKPADAAGGAKAVRPEVCGAKE